MTAHKAMDAERMTRAQRAALPISAEVAQALAEQHGVCIRPLAMRRIDTTTGRIDIIPVPCGSTRDDQCRPCADKARRLRMAQCRQGWHLDTEPLIDRTTPTEDHKELMAARADLVAAYTECKTQGDETSCEHISDSVAELDAALREAGVRGRLTPLDPPPKAIKRTTRRRQDAPNLPRRPIQHRTIGVPVLISVPQAAELLGISRASAYRYAESGELPVKRFGGRVFVVRDRLRDLLEAA